MLEYIEVEQFASFSSDKVKIRIEDDKVYYSLDFMKSGKFVKDEIAECTPERFEEMLASIQIKNWKKHYEPDMIFLDGTDWTVKYKEKDGKLIKFSGENEWPRNWKHFLMAIKVVTGDLGELDNY